jgi:hypothetical protein
MSAYNAAPIKFSGVSSTTNSLGVNDPQTGDRCEEGGVSYLYVYNGSANSNVYPGYGVVPQAGSTAYTMTLSSVTDTDWLAGVCVNATIATGYYGWVATRGYVHVVLSTASAVTGDLLGVGVNGTCTRHNVSATTDVAIAPFFGKFVTSVATAGTGTVYLSTYS